MIWSRKSKIYDCRKCLYHGVPRNAKNACMTSGNCTAKKHGREGVKYAMEDLTELRVMVMKEVGSLPKE